MVTARKVCFNGQPGPLPGTQELRLTTGRTACTAPTCLHGVPEYEIDLPGWLKCYHQLTVIISPL